MRVVTLAALGAALILCGCASVVRGTSEQVQFDSVPAGAQMRSIVKYECGGPCPQGTDRTGMYLTDEQMKTPLESGPACVTPCMAQVPRNQELIVTFSKPGYESQTVSLRPVLSAGGAAGFAGNAILGGVVGAVVDTGTGAAMDHQPNPLKVVLKPVRGGEPKRKNASAAEAE
jgi:hypothetical protein